MYLLTLLENHHVMKTLKHHLSNPYLAFVLGNLFMILGSAKWTVFIGPWLGLPLILYFMRKVKIWKAIVFGFLGLFASGLISAYEASPAPLPVLIVIMLIITFKSVLPYMVDRLSKAEKRGFFGTLIFPAAMVVLEYLTMLESGAIWNSIANSQYQFLALQQIASLFGIWGITFLIAWFASLVNWMSEQQWTWARIRSGAMIAGGVYVAVLAFGIIRISQVDYIEDETVRIGGVTLDNSNIMEAMYRDEFGKTLTISPETSQAAPELQEATRAMVPFIEDPHTAKFENTLREMNTNLNVLFDRTAQLAEQGAKIVVWSEAIGLTLNTREDAVIARAGKLARDKGIYLFMSLGVVNPGPYTPERLLVVNKTITLGPDGEVANVYLKSNPIPFAEQEYGSDDIIPVIDTPYGRLSPVICYDADFPEFLKQTNKIGTDILIVPSGDWKAIDPYHAYMSSLRGIENGVSVVRPVSRGTSIATDPYGNLLASTDFFNSEDKTMVANVPMQGINTIYNRIGDLLPYVTLVFIAYILLEIFVRIFRKRISVIPKTRVIEA